MIGKIEKLSAREVLDSRGNPTVEAVLVIDSKKFKASVPSGASTGIHEAVELRDKNGGVSNAIENINRKIAPHLLGKKISSQKEIDDLMISLDGTENKSKLGGNAICAVSLVICRAAAEINNLDLFKHIGNIATNEHSILINKYNIPSPSFNIINGGRHAKNGLNVQEFMVVPSGNTFSEKMKKIKTIYDELKNIVVNKFGINNLVLGDEGGFSPSISKTRDALDLILKSTKKEDVSIVIDVAASEIFKDNKYEMDGQRLDKKELLNYYKKLVSDYPLIGIEDPFSEDDWNGFSSITESLGENISIIGDDLLVTNPKRIKEAKEKKAVNAALLKINQIGTVSEALDYAKLARDFGWKIMVSHRSGETMDSFIADFAVAINSDFIKSGAPSQKERMAKYNRLLEIEKII